ncbi:hypothetical protein GCM10007170_40590 [Arthrobacter liuii]|uniref:Uncharacterized protein n=1 Tax=Arthrobacter liuii TaxID=1476996 RepID=A0ABQ2AXL2_9MICC|nr:hypothetical protein GCM10007170_40590 [Arthrobacter liuii]
MRVFDDFLVDQLVEVSWFQVQGSDFPARLPANAAVSSGLTAAVAGEGPPDLVIGQLPGG